MAVGIFTTQGSAVKKIEIKSFIKNSLLDWDGKIVSVVYLAGCNFRCPFCHNATLVLNPHGLKAIEFEEVAEYVKQNRIFIDGVCVTGGEPCLYNDLSKFLNRFKSLDVLVKLDTNGFYPETLKEITNSNLVDYIAMDIKAPLVEEKYSQACGIKNDELLPNIKNSINIIMNSPVDYEFRITVVPTLHSKQEILEVAKGISGAKKLALQNFLNYETLDPEFKNIRPYSIKQLQDIAEDVRSYVEKCVVRGGA